MFASLVAYFSEQPIWVSGLVAFGLVSVISIVFLTVGSDKENPNNFSYRMITGYWDMDLIHWTGKAILYLIAMAVIWMFFDSPQSYRSLGIYLAIDLSYGVFVRAVSRNYPFVLEYMRYKKGRG
jgi:hypothetical protein